MALVRLALPLLLWKMNYSGDVVLTGLPGADMWMERAVCLLFRLEDDDVYQFDLELYIVE